MIITIDEVVTEGEDTFNRKRTYCLFCVEHTSSIPELHTLKDELSRIMKDTPASDIEVYGARDYEENMEWDKIEILMPNGTEIELGESYTGLWELMSYDKLTEDAQRTATNDLLGHYIYEIDYHIGVIERELAKDEYNIKTAG